MTAPSALRELDQAIDQLGLTLDDVHYLWDIADTLSATPRLRSILVDVSVDAQSRHDVAVSLFESKVSANATAAIATCARLGIATPRIDRQIEREAIRAAWRGANDLGRVQDEVFAFSRLVDANQELSTALRNLQVPLEGRQQLAVSVLSDVDDLTKILVARSIRQSSGTLAKTLADYIELASQINHHRVAYVSVAAPISGQQRDRLVTQLERIYGNGVDVHISVDPSVIGGALVQIDDERIDGTVRKKLNDMRQQIRH